MCIDVNQSLPSLHGGSLEITLTVPWRLKGWGNGTSRQSPLIIIIIISWSRYDPGIVAPLVFWTSSVSNIEGWPLGGKNIEIRNWEI